MIEYPTVAIVGPGAIGTTIAAVLHEVGRTPTICGRTPHAQLTLKHDNGTVVIPGPVICDPKQISSTYDVVFVAVKSTQLDRIQPWLSVLCSDSTVICVLQNGVEQVSSVSQYHDKSTILPSVVWFPAQRESDTEVWLRAKPRLSLPQTEGADTVVAALQGTTCTVDVAIDFTSVAWKKLVQNAVAGLMVLTCRRAGMYRRSDIFELAVAYAHECLVVARSQGAKLDDQLAREIAEKFSSSPADLGTSILADRQAGRPLEWRIRNEVIQRVGRAKGVPTPISDVVVPLLAAASDGPG